MRVNMVAPLDVPKDLGVEDLLFMSVDERGLIVGMNQAFVAASDYSSEELMGQSHTLTHHPDMPQCMTALMKTYHKSKQTMGMYVKHMAKSGQFYWVFSLRVPKDGGFIAISFKPSTKNLGIITGIYSELAGVEKSATQEGSRGTDRAGELLVTRLLAVAEASYDAFMSESLRLEIAARRVAMGSGYLPSSQVNALFSVFDRMSDLTSLGNVLGTKQAFFNKLGRDISQVALNANVAASKLSEAGRALGVISEEVSSVATGIASESKKLSEGVSAMSDLPCAMYFVLGQSMLLLEMSEKFTKEGQKSGLKEEEQILAYGLMLKDHARKVFRHYKKALGGSGEVVLSVANAIYKMNSFNSSLNNLLINLQLGYVTGKSISVRVTGGEQFSLLLQDMTELSEKARIELASVEGSVDKVDSLVSSWKKSRVFSGA